MTIIKRTVEPDTARLIEGLRDTGYTFPGAIADIVDNSVMAGADAIHVQVSRDALERISVLITDNGCGMSEDGLENAMRYGSLRQPGYNSLSKFGLGLKTASTSFCRQLTVLSAEPAGSTVSFAQWDLDDVAAAGKWELQIGDADADWQDVFADSLERLGTLAGQTVMHGTVVVWDKVDRLMKTKNGQDAAQPAKYLTRLVNELHGHLAMVFQRYLDAEDDRARNVRIWLNDQPIAGWDPFCTKWTEHYASKTIKVRGLSGNDEVISLRAYILPATNQVDDVAYKEMARISNERQGIYLYRENRLIEGPDWLGFGAADTHLNNLRVELSFPGELDEIFGIDVKKSKVHIDNALHGELFSILGPIRREADNVSRSGKTTKLAKGGSPSRPTELTIKRTIGGLNKAKVVETPDGGVSLVNNAGTVPLADADGNQTGPLPIHLPENHVERFVERSEMLENGALWEPFYSPTSGEVGVTLNAGHDWYRKAYVRIAGDTNLVQAIEYLMFALAQAEANNTDMDIIKLYKEFRYDVGSNLRKLMADVPEPEFEAE